MEDTRKMLHCLYQW